MGLALYRPRVRSNGVLGSRPAVYGIPAFSLWRCPFQKLHPVVGKVAFARVVNQATKVRINQYAGVEIAPLLCAVRRQVFVLSNAGDDFATMPRVNLYSVAREHILTGDVPHVSCLTTKLSGAHDAAWAWHLMVGASAAAWC
jgi:hypothetical protein